jgi:pyruvate,water dikinase
MPARRFTLPLSESRDTALVGGKAASLGRLAQAGLPVPDGCVVSTEAYLYARGRSSGKDGTLVMPTEVAEEIRSAYRGLGAPLVAVRSSATAEDMAGASMAGQYETFLNVQGEQAVVDAVERCWASLAASRVRTYLREHSIDPATVAMAVVVQRLVPADVAGVLFTVDPRDAGRREMLLEASWGLGETVVSGQVQPDVFRLEYDTGRVLEASIADKRLALAPGSRSVAAVDEQRRSQPCLAPRDLAGLWHLGRRVADHFGRPMDLEWAIHSGEVFLLQARPITTLQGMETQQQILGIAQAHLHLQSAAGRGPWVLHNLAETLPHPTPLTWSVIRRFMSGAGGFGAMYRQAGFEPSPGVCKEGFLENVAGRIYMDVSLAPEMMFEGFPFAYDLEQLKASPDASQTPPTVPTGSVWRRWEADRKLKVAVLRLDGLAARLERELRDHLFAEVTSYVAKAKALNLESLPGDRLQELWREHQTWALEVFGPRLLMPGLIGAMAMGRLRDFLQENVWDEDAEALCRRISSGGQPDRTVTANAELYEVGKGHRSLKAWLAVHGHRAVGEFDLAASRWREIPSSVREMAAQLATGEGPLDRHGRSTEQADACVAAISLRLGGSEREEFDRLVGLTRRHLVLREDSKDVLMLAYDLLRDVALEAGRRLAIGGDVFYLTADELLVSLRTGAAPTALISHRKTVYAAEARLQLPRLIDAASIESLGRPRSVQPASGGHAAFAVSGGEAWGPARIVHSPTEAGDLGRGYILVCPSTDPSWTPLFVNAAGLVLECGGTLSHGAVVAREMGLPAVVLADATRLFKEGQEIRVDGLHGWAGPLQDGDGQRLERAADAEDTSIPRELIPPPAGRKDRLATLVSTWAAAGWLVFLAAMFLLPQAWVHQPALGVMDNVLWPVVKSLGRPAVVVVVAAAVAILTLLVQRLLTDNPRLLEAQARASALRKLAAGLNRTSPRHGALIRQVAAVQARTLTAAMVPVGLLLGALVMPFVWFRQRIDPATWSPEPGSSVQIVASVDSDWSQPVRLEVQPPLAIDDSTPQSRRLPEIRATLEHLLYLYLQPHNDANEPWELKSGPNVDHEQAARELESYLAAGVPPQGITWLVRTPEGQPGRFDVKVTAEGHPAVTAGVVLGADYPPGPARVAGPAGSPVRQLRVVVPRPKVKSVFWQPLAMLAGHDAIPFASRLAAMDVGWLWLYILVYVPVLFVARRGLKVA